MSVSIALFDFGNVVAGWNPTAGAEEYARRSGLSPSEVRDRLATDGFWIATDRGAYSLLEMQARICELLAHQFSLEELLRLQMVAFDIRPEIVSIAKAVRTQVPVGILTNNAPLLKEAFPRHFSELSDVFDPVLFSFQFGHVKPEPELFEAVQAHLDLPPTEILFIDDTSGHVAAAESMGWDAVLFKSAGQLRRSLVQRGLHPGAS